VSKQIVEEAVVHLGRNYRNSYKMKKIYLFFLIMAISTYSFPQGSNTLMLNLGSTSFSGIMDKSAEMGLNCAVSINRIHFDVSSNLMNNNRSLSLGVFNLGYVFPVNPLVSIVPVMGVGYSNGNYAGSYNSDILHNGNNTYYANLGFLCNMKLGKNIGIYTGIGTFESFRMGIVIGGFSGKSQKRSATSLLALK
jgi:hypothetical protein